MNNMRKRIIEIRYIGKNTPFVTCKDGSTEPAYLEIYAFYGYKSEIEDQAKQINGIISYVTIN